MARFIFPMQNILNMKEKLEDQEKNNYSQANLRLQEAIADEQALRKRQADAQLILKDKLNESLDVREIERRENNIEILKMYVMEAHRVVEERESELELARRRLNEAMKERKTFEKLRERAFEEFIKEENLREQKEVDELVSYRFGSSA